MGSFSLGVVYYVYIETKAFVMLVSRVHINTYISTL